MASGSRLLSLPRGSLPVRRASTAIAHRRSPTDIVSTKQTEVAGSRVSTGSDGRKYLGWEGRRYPLDWKGEFEEGGWEKIDRWTKEGKWNTHEHRPNYFLPHGMEKNKMWQMFYERPAYNNGTGLDAILWNTTMLVMGIVVLSSFLTMYRLIVPESQRLKYKYGDRSYFGQEKSYK